jgi:uncharacterized damage-inducible protein DinB
MRVLIRRNVPPKEEYAMHSKSLLLTMFDFNHSINTRLLGIAAELPPEQWDAPQTIGRASSLHETFFHIITVEEEWRLFCETGGKDYWGFRPEADFPDAASLIALADQEYEAVRAYLTRIPDEGVMAPVTGILPHGVTKTAPAWHFLTHSLFHSAQHRSETAIMLTAFGHSPSFIDFLGFNDYASR